MTPTQRTVIWGTVGAIIGIVGAWDTNCGPLRIATWAAVMGVAFIVPVRITLAIEAADRRALRPVVIRDHSHVVLTDGMERR